MQAYRIYTIGPDGKIAGPSEIVECPTDEEALAEAQTQLAGHAIEVWKGAKLIAHFDPMVSATL
jgi:hypothetical protein